MSEPIPHVAWRFRVLSWLFFAGARGLFEIERFQSRRVLASPDFRARLERIRRESPDHANRKRLWEQIFRGKRVIAVGSAPEFVPPAIRDDDVILAVNTSLGVLAHHQLRRPDAVLLNSNVFGPRKSLLRRAWALQILADQSTDHVMLVDSYMGTSFAGVVLGSVGFRYRTMSTLGRLDRYAITGEVSAEDNAGSVDATNSTGISAVAIALWCGAREVVMCGYSLRGGVGIVDSAPIRSHVASDRRFLEICVGQGRPVSTTSVELQREVGLPAAV